MEYGAHLLDLLRGATDGATRLRRCSASQAAGAQRRRATRCLYDRPADDGGGADDLSGYRRHS